MMTPILTERPGRRPGGGSEGFTLLEILVTVMLVGFVIVEILQLFITSSIFAETGGNVTFAMNAAERVMEEIQEHNFDDVVGDYSGYTFAFTDPEGSGTVYIDATDPELLVVKVAASWKGKDGRVIGEDQDLDGVLDAGEDTNGNGELDSPVTLITLLADRT